MIYIYAQSLVDAERYAAAHGLRHADWIFLMHEAKLNEVMPSDEIWLCGEYKRRASWGAIRTQLNYLNLKYKEIA